MVLIEQSNMKHPTCNLLSSRHLCGSDLCNLSFVIHPGPCSYSFAERVNHAVVRLRGEVCLIELGPPAALCTRMTLTPTHFTKFDICPLNLPHLDFVLNNATATMASQQAADSVKNAVQNVTEKVKDMTTADGPQQNLLLDEVTGERVSKTELKKRQKARDKDAKKAEKEATKQAPPQPKRKAASQEEEEGKLNANVSQYIPLFVTPLRV